MSRRFQVPFAVVALALVSCGPTKGSGDPDAPTGDPDASNLPHTLTGILVQPLNPIIELDLNTPGAQAFTATGQYMDNVPEDLTAQVTWSVANPAVGAMSGPMLAIPAFAAVSVEVSTITASFGGFDGVAQITVVAYRRSGPAQDFFFVLPYTDPGGPATRPLDFSTVIPSLDVFFLMDTTGSMLGSITNLQNALTSIVLPGVQAEVPNSQFGAGSYEDFPVLPYGSLAGSDCFAGGLPTPDQPFHLFQTITNSTPAVQAGVAMMRTATGPIGCGQDWPESGFEALYQVATGEGLSSPSPTNVPANATGVGGVGFRADTMPVVVQITDAMSHGPGETGLCPTTFESADYTGAVAAVAHTRAQAKAALGAICARVVGVAAQQPSLAPQCSGQADLEDFAQATGARVPPSAWDVPVRPPGCPVGQCCTGINGVGRAPDGQGLCPVVFLADASGTGLGAHIVTGIKMLTRFATFDVTSERQGVTTSIDGVPLPAPYTTADFIRAVTPTGFTLPPPPPAVPAPTFDTMTFSGVTPGTTLAFDVNAYNDFVPQTQQAQIFRATIRVLAGGCTPLDEREVLILVPPNPIVVD
jgi:hypothetical protein